MKSSTANIYQNILSRKFMVQVGFKDATKQSQLQ